MMKLVFLGTSGAMPTKDRGLSSTVLVLEKEYIMVDCGDGTCRQYLKSNLKWNKPLTILITHMHSDHTMGILGLLQSMDLMGRTEPVIIYGVRGIKKFILDLHRGVQTKFGFEFKVIEIPHGFVIHGDDHMISTHKSKHQFPSLAYKVKLADKAGKLDIDKCMELGVPENSPLLGKLKKGVDVFLNNKQIKSSGVVGLPQKGLTVGFSGDTRPTVELKKFFTNIDYLLWESTFRDDEIELARKAKHSTASEAGKLAKDANVKHLMLNHFSARHPTTQGFYDDASKYHHDVTTTSDFLEIELK